MMVSVHAAVGAGMGGVVRYPGQALAAGVVSHLLCDLVPHRDYDIRVEAPLALAVFLYLVLYLAGRYGVRSPQFWGAAGAVPAGRGERPWSSEGHSGRAELCSRCTTCTTRMRPGSRATDARVDSPLPRIALAALALYLAERGKAM